MTENIHDYVPSLITETPFEGRQLAITPARKSIHEMQFDPEIKKEIRQQYAHSGIDLISAARVIAAEFQQSQRRTTIGIEDKP